MHPCARGAASRRIFPLKPLARQRFTAGSSRAETNIIPMNDFERQSRRSADHDDLSDTIAEEISLLPTEVIDIGDAPPLAPPAPLNKDEVRTIVISLMLTMFLAALDQTIVATALPTIGRQFHDVTNLSWVITAYLLAATAVAPVFGTLSDIYGRRAMMLTAIGVFHAVAARQELVSFFRTSVWVRFGVLATFVAMAALGVVPPMVIAFGLVDAATAIWTLVALRERGVVATPAQ